MADQLELLKQLQVLDGQLFRLRKQQQEKPRELDRASAETAEQQGRLKTVEDRVNALQLGQKHKEMELQTREEHIKKLQSQLFQVKTNKEYTALQREIDTLKADKSTLEEGIISAFDTIEDAVKQRQEQQRRVAEQQERLRAERARIERELAEIGDQVAQLERSRQALAPEVPPPALTLYERVLRVREGLALVPLMNDSCGGCHRRLPPQVVNQVLLKADLVTCESCNRILYFDEAHSKL